LDAHSKPQLARQAATILATPPALVTLFFLMLLGSGGSEDFAVSDVLAGWAVLAGPLAVARAGLFVVSRRAAVDAPRDQAGPGTSETT